MRCVDEPGRSLRLFRLAVLATISVAAVSCSANTNRFESDKFFRSNAQAPAERGDWLGHERSMPSSEFAVAAAHGVAPGTRPVVIGTSGGSRGMASYRACSGRSDVTGRSASRIRLPLPSPRWKWDGGTPIIVQKGDTIDGLVARYGVPASAIAEPTTCRTARR